jgi:hypothetical protein
MEKYLVATILAWILFFFYTVLSFMAFGLLLGTSFWIVKALAAILISSYLYTKMDIVINFIYNIIK